MIVFIIIGAIFGALVGSFINVVIMRINTGRLLGGRSQCMACKKQLHWYELIPMVSFLLVKGRCRSCLTSLSRHYLWGELSFFVLFGGIAAYSWIHFADSLTLLIINTVVWMIIATLGIALSLYDIRHMIVPNQFVYPLITIGLASLFLYTDMTWGILSVPSIIDVAAGPLVALPFFLIWYFSRGRLFGFGDVKIMLAMGWLLGVLYGFMAITLAFWIAGITIGILWIYTTITQKKNLSPTLGMAIPFGPFLIIGLFVTVFFHSFLHTLLISW